MGADLSFCCKTAQIPSPSGLQPSDEPSVRIGLHRDLGAGELQVSIGGRGGYFPPLIRHSLGYGTHERGSRRLSPHPQPLTRQTPWGAEVRPPPFGRGPRAAAGAPLRRRTKGGTEPRSERRLPLAGGHAVVQHIRVAHTGMHMAVVPRGRGSSRGPRAPPSRSNPSPIYWGACPSRMPLPRPPPSRGRVLRSTH